MMKVVIEALDHFGRGITHINGKVCFVRGALKDEIVDIKITDDKKKYLTGEVEKIIKESKDRVVSSCPYFKECGGCDLRHVSNNLEKEFKETKVKEILKKFAGINEDKILPIVSLNKDGYRNKVVFHVENKRIGFYKRNTHDLIEIDKCLNLDDRINDLIPTLKEIVKKQDIKTIMVRVGNKTDDILIEIDGKTKSKEITSYIKDKKYILTKDDFFQVNKYVTEYLYDEVVNCIKEVKAKNVLDLYCGIGTISIYIKDYVKKVTGVEIVKSSIASANKNKKLNNMDNIDFIASSSDEVYPFLKEKYDTVIVDPPRSGLTKKLINSLIEQKPQNIIYVSCDPVTLARDLPLLKEKYEVCHIRPFDMFFKTYHVECVVLLKLNDK